MPAKLVDAVFRRWWALAIPAILMPLVVFALNQPEPVYRSTATAWVTRPSGDDSVSIGYYNSYLTPAQNRASTLSDLLSTKSFRDEVILASNILGPSPSPQELRRASDLLSAGASSSGTNLIVVYSYASGATEAQAIVNAVLTVFETRSTAEVERTAAATVEYYEQQLPGAEQALNEARADLTAYLRVHPQAATPGSPASLDIDYQALVEQVSSQASVVEDLKAGLSAAQRYQTAAPATLASSFVVQDTPSLPSGPRPVSITSRLGLPIAALFMGILMGAGYIYVTYRADHTIRSSEDLQGLGAPLLGAVPQLDSAPDWARHTPLGVVSRLRNPNYARRVAKGILVPFASQTGRGAHK